MQKDLYSLEIWWLYPKDGKYIKLKEHTVEMEDADEASEWLETNLTPEEIIDLGYGVYEKRVYLHYNFKPYTDHNGDEDQENDRDFKGFNRLVVEQSSKSTCYKNLF